MKVVLNFVPGVEPTTEIFEGVREIKTIDEMGSKRLSIIIEHDAVKKNHCSAYSTPVYLISHLEVLHGTHSTE